ncbi:hypothetical protein [Brevundimonas sp.]|uniref:hypothetical protein n=1 Tax=Brevundimonas sp. TaxID=1871086 RepID=UPI002627E224|nr:hypothetical protein [Brevundimonas sp.]
MNHEDGGWVEGARLALVAVVCAVLTAAVVIQLGGALVEARPSPAETRITLASS